MQKEATRRSLIGFVGLAGAIVAMPAIVVASMPPAPSGVYAKYLAAKARFLGLPESLEWDNEAEFLREQDAFLAADEECRIATPTTWSEFVIWYDAASDGSELSKKVMAIVSDIAASEGR